HVIVVGFGTKGRSAVNTLLDDEDAEPSDVVVVDTDQDALDAASAQGLVTVRSEEHTSELQSRFDLVCRLLLEKKKQLSCSAIRAQHELSVCRKKRRETARTRDISKCCCPYLTGRVRRCTAARLVS